MNKYKIGDLVKIVNDGMIYPTYERIALKLKATKWMIGKMYSYRFKSLKKFTKKSNFALFIEETEKNQR